jgi:hypothetical protein
MLVIRVQSLAALCGKKPSGKPNSGGVDLRAPHGSPPVFLPTFSQRGNTNTRPNSDKNQPRCVICAITRIFSIVIRLALVSIGGTFLELDIDIIRVGRG